MPAAAFGTDTAAQAAAMVAAKDAEARHDARGAAEAAAERDESGDLHPPRFEAREVGARLGIAGDPALERYEVEGYLGGGSTSEVYAVLDRSLGRHLAVKVLARGELSDQSSVASFVLGAQLTAELRHPNILQAVDLDLTRTGQPYLSMHRVDGRTLASAIECQDGATPHAAIASAHGLVSVFIQICQAIAYAHHRGIVHQDIKPDNILIGDFGEVLVLDWGCAARLGPGRPTPAIYGTPIYMSPEQARRERVDMRSDVWCIGATMLHALTRRLPVWDSDPEAFWARKTAGEFDAPTAAERARCDPRLFAIARKALAAEAQDRYADAAELRDELQRYQAGLAIAAYREPWLMRLARWHRRHGRAFWTWTVVAGLMLWLALALGAQRLRQAVTWGRPVLAEDFDDAWTSRWKILVGGFAHVPGWVESTDEGSGYLLYRPMLTGATAIEYDAMSVPGRETGDLSLIWARGLDPTAQGRAQLQSKIEVQIGAFEGSCAKLSDNGVRVDTEPTPIVPGHTYHVRIEIVGDRLDQWVDGAHHFSYGAPFPLDHGYVALYSEHKGQRFSRVRIYTRSDGEVVRATAVGDGLAQNGHYAEAADAYARVAQAHAGTALAEEALYKQGLCAQLSGDPAAADRAWANMAEAGFRDQAAVHRLARKLESQDYDGLLDALGPACTAAGADQLQRLAMLWSRLVDRLLAHGQLLRQEAQRALELHDRFLAGEPCADMYAAELLVTLGRPDLELSRYPQARYQCAQALIMQNRAVQADQRFGEFYYQHFANLLNMGKLDELRHAPPEQVGFELAAGRNGLDADLVYRLAPNDALMLYYQGRFEELARLNPGSSLVQMAAVNAGGIPPGKVMDVVVPHFLLVQGRREELLRERPYTEAALQQLLIDALPRLIAGEAGVLTAVLDQNTVAVPGGVPNYPSLLNRGDGTAHDLLGSAAFDDVMLCAFAADRIDGGHRLHAYCDTQMADPDIRYADAQCCWYAVSYLRGDIDARGFLSQPVQIDAQAKLALLEAMRAEQSSDRAAAVAAYRRFQAEPFWTQGVNPRVLRQRIVAWRLSALGEGAPSPATPTR
jgi:hypothetical protein